MSGISSVVIEIGAQTAQAVSEIGKVDKALGQTQSTGQKFGAGIQKAALPAAAALTAISAAAVVAVKAAADDAESQAKLAGQLERSTGATKAQVASTEDWISSMSKSAAVADDELRPALAQLAGVTGDAKKAQDLLQVSLDLSAATGKPLASTTAAIAKAYDGHAASLGKLVPALDDAAVKAGDWNEIQKELNKQVGGAAAKDADTAAGRARNLTIQFGELQEQIGTALLPVLEQLTGMLLPLLSLAQEHSTVFVVLAGGVAALAAAVLAINAGLKIYNALQTIMRARTILSAAATGIMTAAQWLLNIALDANPIGLVVLALVALGAALVIAWKKSDTFRGIVTDAFALVIKYGWLLLGPLAPFALALKVAWEHSQTFRDIVTGAFDAVKNAIQWVIDKVHELINLIGKIHVPHIDLPGPLGMSTAAIPAGMSAGAYSSTPNINVTIQGAIDPETTALALRKVLERYDRRRGRRPLGQQ